MLRSIILFEVINSVDIRIIITTFAFLSYKIYEIINCFLTTCFNQYFNPTYLVVWMERKNKNPINYCITCTHVCYFIAPLVLPEYMV